MAFNTSNPNELAQLVLVACDMAYKGAATQVLEVLAPFHDPIAIDPEYSIAGNGFIVLERFEHPESGFKSVIFQNTQTKELIVSFAGVDGTNPTDWWSSVNHLGWNQWTAGGNSVLGVIQDFEAQGYKFHFTGQSLGGALAQYAAHDFLRAAKAVDPSIASRVTLTTFNALGGLDGLTSYAPVYDPTAFDGVAGRHYFVTNDLVSKLGSGHVGGATYELPYRNLNQSGPDGQPLHLGVVTSHRIETAFYPYLSDSADYFNAARPGNPGYLSIPTLQKMAAGMGNVFRRQGTNSIAASLDLFAAVLWSAATAPNDEIATMVDELAETAKRSGDLSHASAAIIKAVPWGPLVTLLNAVAVVSSPLRFINTFAGSLLLRLIASAFGKTMTETQTMIQGEFGSTNVVSVADPASIAEARAQLEVLRMRLDPEGGSLLSSSQIDVEGFASAIASGPQWRENVSTFVEASIQGSPSDIAAALADLGRVFKEAAVASANDAYVQEMQGYLQQAAIKLAKRAADGNADFTKKYGENAGALATSTAEGYRGLVEAFMENASSGSGRPSSEFEEAFDILAAAGQAVSIVPGAATNPFNDSGYDPHSGVVPNAELADGAAGSYTVFLPYEAQADGQRVRLKLEGGEADALKVIANGLIIDVVNGEFTLTIAEGQRALTFALVSNESLDEDATLQLKATLVDENGAPTHNTHTELNLTLKEADVEQRADELATLNEIVGDQDPDAVGDFSDELGGTGGNDKILGLTENDFITGEAGQDWLLGGHGDDWALGGGGNDLVEGEEGDDVLIGGDGHDELYAKSRHDRDAAMDSDQTAPGLDTDWLDGEGGNDLLVGSTGANTMAGGGGKDVLIGGAGNDNLVGDAYSSYGPNPPFSGLMIGEDSFSLADGDDDTLFGGGGNDFMRGEVGNDALFGGSGDDQLSGDADRLPTAYHGNDYLDGGAGNDSLVGHGGNDDLIGGDGDDQLFGDGTFVDLAQHGTDYLEGGAGNDYLRGMGGDDILTGGEGNDEILGEEGDDEIYGDAGNDELVAGDGADYVDAGDGDDTVWGEAGIDEIYAGEGRDQVFAGAGNDYVEGGTEDDAILGEEGDDELYGEEGQDQLQGGEGADYLDGGSGNDALFGGGGNDYLWGGGAEEGGEDVAIGGGGSDTYAFERGDGRLVIVDTPAVAGPEATYIELGAGISRNDISLARGTVQLDLGSGATEYNALILELGDEESIWLTGYDPEDPASTTMFGELRLSGGETLTYAELLEEGVRIAGTAGTDFIAGTPIDDVIDGQEGDDSLSGGDGDDTLLGGEGVDGLHGGSGNDTLDGGNGTDFLHGGADDDTLAGGAGADLLFGESGHDVLDGGSESDQLWGGLGNDSLEGGAGGDTLRGEAGNDELSGGGDDDSLFGEMGADVLDGGDGHDSLFAGMDNDEVHGGSGNDELYGDQGNDALYGGDGDDLVVGGDGDDELDGGAGLDVLAGGFGNDTYIGRAGDTVQDERGNNTLVLAGNITAANLEVTQYFGEDGMSYLELKASGDAEGVSVLGGELGYMATYQFADGTTLTHGELLEQYAGDLFIEADSGFFDAYYGGGGNDVIAGADWDDTISGGSGNDGLLGGRGTDSLFGEAGDDTLDGGADADVLDGGTGRDRYRITWGMGRDTIHETQDGSQSVLILDEGVSFSSLTAERQGDDLTIRFRRSGEGVTIADYYGQQGDWLIENAQGESQSLDAFVASAEPDAVNDVAAAKDAYRDQLAAAYRAEFARRGYSLRADGAYHRETTDTSDSAGGTTITQTHWRNTYQTSVQAGDDAEMYTQTAWDSVHIGTTSSSTQVLQTQSGGGSTGQRFTRDIRPAFASAQAQLSSSPPSPAAALQILLFGGTNSSQRIAMPAGTTWMVVGGGYNPYSGAGGYSSASTAFTPAAVWVYPPNYFSGPQSPSPVLERRWGVNSGTTPAPVYRTLTTRQVEFAETFTAEELTAGAGDNYVHADGYALVDAGAGNDIVEAGESFIHNLSVHGAGQIGGFYAGNTGEDLILGSSRDDVVAGGEHADYGDGREGNDVYLVDPSETGEDVIYDTGMHHYSIEGEPDVFYTDTLRFFSGIELSDLSLSWTEQAALSPLSGWMHAYQALSLSWAPDRAVHVISPNGRERRYRYEGDDDDRDSGRGIERIEFGSGVALDMDELALLAPDGPGFNVADLDNVLHGSVRADRISGLDGDDTLYGEGGDDTLHGDAGNDLVYGGDGDDVLEAVEFEYEDLGMESSGYAGHDYLDGGSGDDTLVVESGAVVFAAGGAGEDVLTLQDANAIAAWDPGDGADRYFLNAGRLTLSLGAGVEVNDLGLSVSGTRLDLHIGLETLEIHGWQQGGLYLQLFDGGVSTLVDLGWLASEFDPQVHVLADVLPDYVEAQRTGPAAVGGLLATHYAADGTFGTLSRAQVLDILDGYALSEVAYYGTMGDDALEGTDNEDYLQAHDGEDTLRGGLGFDVLEGGEDGDLYFYDLGDGPDLVRDTGTQGVDAIVFGAGITLEMLSWEFSDYDALFIGEDGPIYIDGTTGADLAASSIEEVRFADGTVVSWTELAHSLTDLVGTEEDDALTGTGHAERIFGLAGDDSIDAGEGNDTLIGGQGADELSGGLGDDVYVFEQGDGFDTLFDFDGVVVLRFGAGIAAEDLDVLEDPNAARLTIAGEDVGVQIEGWSWAQQIERVEFADGTVWNRDDLSLRAGRPNEVEGTDGPDHLEGTPGPDEMDGFDGDDEILGLAGDDALDGGNGDDELFGGEGDDDLDGGDDDDTLHGGAGNDTLRGGDGNDTYVLGAGFGADEILDDFAGFDTVSFTDASAADVELGRAGMDLLVTVGSDLLRIVNWYEDFWFGQTRLERFEFADGTVWQGTTLQNLADNAPATLVGTDADDVLIGSEGADRLRGLAGQDALHGLEGNDVFVFGRGDGEDGIYQSSAAPTDVDAIQFTSGITGSDVRITRWDNGIRFTIIDTGDTITQHDWFDSDAPIAEVRFADGTVWDATEIEARIEVAPGTEGDDTINGTEGPDQIFGLGGEDEIYGFGGADTIDGGAGGDYLEGGHGSDVYVFEGEFGWDYVYDEAGAEGEVDTIRFGEGVSASDVTVHEFAPWETLTFRIAGVGDRVDTYDWRFDSVTTIERVEFADGTVWTAEDVEARISAPVATEFGDLLAGGEGDDTIAGGGGDDTLFGLAGSDILRGGEGSDYLSDSGGANLLEGGAGEDGLNTDDGAAAVLIGGAGADGMSLFGAPAVVAFNSGDGQDSLGIYGSDWVLSLGGGIQGASLVFSREFSWQLRMEFGGGDRIDLNYDAGYPEFWSSGTLQIIGEDVRTYDLNGLVTAFDAARAADPGLTSWSAADALDDHLLSVSTTHAFGGAIAYRYATDGSTGGLTEAQVRAVLEAEGFGEEAQEVAVAGNAAPTLANALADQVAAEDSAFAFTVPADAFADPDAADTLTYTATLADGSALPAWLSFDQATRTFSGTPLQANAGAIDVRVRATDGGGLHAEDTFTLNVAAVNDAPVVSAPATQVVLLGDAVAAGSLFTVTDEEGQAPTQYQFWDSTAGNGHFTVNGVEQGVNVGITVSAAELAATRFVGAASIGSDQVWVRAHDGEAWGEWKSWTMSSAPHLTNAAPVATAAHASLLVNEVVAADSLFDVADADGDAIVQYQFWDDVNGGGYFRVNGAQQGAAQGITVSAADLANTEYVGGASPGTEQVWVRATDGMAWGAWKAWNMTSALHIPNAAPVVTAANQTVVFNQAVGAASLFGVSDADGDAIAQYEFWDSTAGNGYFTVAGVAQGVNVAIPVAASALGDVQFVGAPTFASDTVWVRAHDGATWGDWKSWTMGSTAHIGNEAPVVAAANVAISVNEAVAASSLFSVSDADADAIVQYQFYDDVSGGGFWRVNGVQQAAGQSIAVAAADLASTEYIGGATGGTEQVWVRASDGAEWSAWKAWNMTTALHLPNEAPVVSASNLTVLHSQEVQAASLFSVTDADGDAITAYQFWDSTAGNGHFTVDGVAQGVNVAIDVSAAQLAEARFVGSASIGADTVWVRVSDGSTWSDWKSWTMSSAPHLTNEAPVASASAAGLLRNEAVAAGSLFTVVDVDSDAITQYQLWDDVNGGGYWRVDGVQQAAGAAITVAAEDITGTQYVGGANAGTEQVWVRAYDGMAWGAWKNWQMSTEGGMVRGGTGPDVLAGDAQTPILEGGAGDDTLEAGPGNSLGSGGSGNDTVNGGSGNDLLAGGAGDDAIETGAGSNVVVFNAGDGADVVTSAAGASNTLSLGGGIDYDDVTFAKDGNDLIVNTGGDDQLVFKDWYSGKDNVDTLQIILDASAAFDANSSDPLYNRKVQTFDFRAMVNAFDQARAETPGLSSWAVTNALLSAHLAGSDDEALGGDLAYWYGRNGGFAGIGLQSAMEVLGAGAFGADAQTLRPFNGLQEGFTKLS